MSQYAAKNWCFTINNFTEEELVRVREFCRGCSFAIFQIEKGEEGTRHIQGYCQLSSKQRLGWLKKNFNSRAHYEGARGSPKQNVEYCSKLDTRECDPETFGELRCQGHRSDLESIPVLLAEGGLELVRQEAPVAYIKYTRGIQAMASALVRRRDFKTQVLWYWGPTGTGKSKTAFELYPHAYFKSGGSRWWDGYEGEECVIVDDYRRDLCTFSELLRLFDRYPYRVEFKGGSREFTSRCIIITTPKPPRETWEGRTDEDIAQLLRRIDEIKEFK